MNFRDMTPEQRRACASRGGQRAHQIGTGRQWTREQAAEAGRKGGTETARRKQGRQAVTTATTEPQSETV